MASNSMCSACLRALRQDLRLHRRLPRYQVLTSSRNRTPRRCLATTSSLLSPAETSKKQPPPPKPRASSDTLTNIATSLRSNLRGTTEPYVAFGATEDLFRACNAQCSYTVPSALTSPPSPPPKTATGEDLGQGQGWWLESKASGGLGLPTTFNTWAQVMFLHMWLLTVRLRCFPAKYVRDWHQNLLDHFFYAAEERMATWHGMAARGTRNKYLKDLWAQWRGILLSYDEGLIKGDAVMAAALWRNVFKGEEGVDIGDLAIVTAYTMRELQMLGKLDDTQIAEGRVKFGDPRVLGLASLKSPSMKKQINLDETTGAGVNNTNSTPPQ